MGGTIAPFPLHQFFDDNGDPAVGYQLFVYLAGTTTKTTTWSDAAMSSANTNPAVLPADGRLPIFLEPGLSYKFVLAPPLDTDPPLAPLWTIDQVSAVPASSTAADLDVTGTAGEGITAGDAVYLSDGSGGLTAGRFYLTDADNVYSSTGAQVVGFAVASLTIGSTGTFRRGGRITGLAGLVAGTPYFISATPGQITTVAPANARVIAIADSATSAYVQGGEVLATATMPGIIGFGAQTLGTGIKTVDGLISNSTPNYKPGGAATIAAKTVGVVSINIVDVPSVGAGPDNLMTYALPAGTLNVDGKSALRVTAWGSYGATANAKTLTAVFGATSIAVGGGSPNNVPWSVMFYVVRNTATTQVMTGWGGGRSAGVWDGFSPAEATPAETLANAITIKFQSTGTAANDVIQKGMIVEVLEMP